jgi:hypothetical protein
LRVDFFCLGSSWRGLLYPTLTAAFPRCISLSVAESSSEMRIVRTPVIISVQSTAGAWIVESEALNIFRENKSRFTYHPCRYLSFREYEQSIAQES